VIAGTGSNNTKHALSLSLEAQSLGVDALLIVTPYYNKTSQKGLVDHYTYIADRVDIPIILYNVPSRTGVNIEPETYKILSRHPRICAIKEASGNITKLAKTVSICGDNLSVYSGNDNQSIPVLSLGGIGVISVFANVFPKKSHEIIKYYLDGDYRASRELFFKFLDVIDALFSDVNPVPIKTAMNFIGIPCGKCRLPLTEMNESAKENLRNKLLSCF
jgi:4-hydroxy-tetrahydrodipicolinate synthase